MYVLGCAWLVPQIGTGQVIVLVLFGQLFFSAIIDNWGLLHSKVNPINLMRILGLITMFIGVVVLHFI
ncbi:DMT family transporter [Ligilactobacillus salivarius]|uniref:DMT family transporter n=1 Tax=Ligilactobacillus salivarius TaxID=1624 RepID=UPI003B019569